MRGCFAQWLSGGKGEKRAVKHGKSGLRAAICALFGTSRGDLCKTVEKLCKSLQGVKTKNTNCAQRFVRLCVLVRELCKYRFRAAFGVWALWCGGAPFGRFPSRLRRRGAHLGGGGGALREGASAFAFALPTLRSALRPSAGRGAAVDKLTRGVRTGRGGDYLVHSAFAHSDSAYKRHCSALLEGASAFAFTLPHPAHGGAGHGGTTARTLFRSGANTPRERPTGERYIIYTRAQARGRERFAQGGEQRCG